MAGRIERISLSPREARCGEAVVVTISMRIGPPGLRPDGALVVDCPGYLGASRPQFLYQEQTAFVTLNISEPDIPWRGLIGPVERQGWITTREEYDGLVEKRYRPMRLIGLVFPEGLVPGIGIEIRLGAGGGGFTPGYTVGSVAPRPYFQHRFLVRAYERIDAPEALEEHILPMIVHAREAVRGQVIRHATGKTHVVFSDIFGNPARLPDAAQVCRCEGGQLYPTAHNTWFAETPDLIVRKTGGLPIAQCAPMHDVFDGYSIFWGDLHTHSAISCDVKRTERSEMRPKDMLRFGREGSCLDFMALTDHHFQEERDRDRAMSCEEWEETVQAVDAATAEGDFVAIAGYEHRCRRGDTVALFGRHPTYEEITDPAVAPVEELWAGLRHRDVLTMPHFHNPGRLPEGEWIAPDEIACEPAMEVFSCHGRFDVAGHDGMPLAPPAIKSLRADRNGQWMLERGHRYGIMCSSDGHKGRPGTNGLVAVYAKDLTRKAIFEALRNRRCYGTTNARIRLLFTANDRLMGSELRTGGGCAFRVQVSGTGPLSHIDVIRNGELHKRFRPEGPDFTEEWRQEPSRESACWRVRAVQADGEMAFSSPIWIDPE